MLRVLPAKLEPAIEPAAVMVNMLSLDGDVEAAAELAGRLGGRWNSAPACPTCSSASWSSGPIAVAIHSSRMRNPS
jgi:hypothetical protein